MYWVYQPAYYYPSPSYPTQHFLNSTQRQDMWQFNGPSWHENNNHFSTNDYGQQPFVVNINEAARRNNTFRTAIWTGEYLQVTLMSINVAEDIGIETHPDTDQVLRVEQGEGVLRIWEDNDSSYDRPLSSDSVIMIPAGTWHNVINTGNVPLKLYSIYAPPHHPYGTVETTKSDAMKEKIPFITKCFLILLIGY